MEKVIQKWSLEVVTVPQEEIVNLPAAATENTTPVKIKIRIKKRKSNSVCQQKVISEPKIEQDNEYTEKIRVIHSDQTIMSFNMKPEYKSNTYRKSQNKFIHLFKTGKCLGTQDEDNDDPPYSLATPVKLNKEDTERQELYNEKQNTNLTQNKSDIFFLGKCKRGGCFDPPFGEDKYRYQPSIQRKQGPQLNRKENYQVITHEKPNDNKTKHSELTLKISNFEEITTFSTLMLYKARSEKSSVDEKYSDSIITYPPESSSKDLGITEKNNMTRNSSVVKNRLSSNTTDTYFMPPKADKTPDKNVHRHKMIIKHQEEELKDSGCPNDVAIPVRADRSMLSENIDVVKVTEDILLNISEIKEPVAASKIETIKLSGTGTSEFTEKKALCQPLSQSIIHIKSQDVKSKTEDFKEIDKFRASTDNITLKTINDTTGQVANNLKNKSFTIIQNEENNSLKYKNSVNEIKDEGQRMNKNFTITSLRDDNTAEPTLTYNSEQKPQIVKKISSDFNTNAQLTSEKNNTITSTNSINIIKSNSTKDILSESITEHKIKIQEEDLTNKLNLLDHIVLQVNSNNNEYIQNVEDEQNLLQSEKKTQNETSKIPSGESQLGSNETEYPKDVVDSLPPPKLLRQNLENQNINGSGDDENHKEVSNVSGFDEINDIADFKDYHQKDTSSAAKIKNSITAAPTHWNGNKTSIHRDSYTLSSKLSVSDLIDNEEKSSVNLQPVDNQNKSGTAVIENNNAAIKITTFAIDNNVIDENKTKQSTINVIDDESQIKTSPVRSRENIIKENTLQVSTKQLTGNLTDNENQETIKPVSSQGTELDKQNKKDFSENNKMFVLDLTDVTDKNSITNLKQNIQSESFSKYKTISGDLKSNKTFVPFNTEVISSNTLIAKQSVLSSTDFHKNKNEFENRGKMTDSASTDKDIELTSLEEKQTLITEASLVNKIIYLNLAFQTYINDKNETIIRTFEASKEPQRFANDSITVIKSMLKLNDNKSFAINSNTKLFIKINSNNNNLKDQERFFEAKGNLTSQISGEMHTKDNDIEKQTDLGEVHTLQRSLVAIYENDLVPVEKSIKNLILEIDRIAKYRLIIKNKLIVARKLRISKPTYSNKRCRCLRK